MARLNRSQCTSRLLSILLIALVHDAHDAIGISSFDDNKRNVMLLSTFLFGSTKIHLHREPWALTHLPKVTITANACVLDLASRVRHVRKRKESSAAAGRIVR